MSPKAFNDSEWDLNINLSINTSPKDFSFGFINTAFIEIIKQTIYINLSHENIKIFNYKLKIFSNAK